MSTVIFTFSHRSMISSAHHRNKKGLSTYNFQIICDLFLALHLTQQQPRSKPCETTYPLKGPGTGLANPAFTLTPVLGKSRIIWNLLVEGYSWLIQAIVVRKNFRVFLIKGWTPPPSKKLQFPYSDLRQHTNSFHLGPVMRITVTELMWNIEITIILYSPEFSLNVSCW